MIVATKIPVYHVTHLVLTPCNGSPPPNLLSHSSQFVSVYRSFLGAGFGAVAVQIYDQIAPSSP